MKKVIAKHINDITSDATECLVVFSAHALSANLKTLDKQLNGLITKGIKRKEWESSIGSSWMINTPDQTYQRVLLISTGKSKAVLSNADWLRAVSALIRQLKNKAFTRVTIDTQAVSLLDCTVSPIGFASLELKKACYQYTASLSATKGKPSTPFDHIKQVTFAVESSKEKTATQKDINAHIATAHGINHARELGNLPGNYCTPSFLADEARKLAKSSPLLSCKVLNEKRMRELKMDSLLSVSAGSDEEAKLIQLEYKGGKKSDKPIVLVGKGITFDSGGISLKPGSAMDEMKFDMCGAASVMGVFHALAEHNIKLNVTGIIPASENMPNGNATKPGDVITSMSGQTIEILNTDAEGRLVLCDALTYAQTFHKPKQIIDLATLTGACIVALGSHAAALYSNDEALASQLLESGTQVHDRLWRMPLWEDYNKQLKSNFADLANIGGPKAGSVTAACFLSNFIDDGVSWAHLDIAGIAWTKGGTKGATGRPVAMLMNYLHSQV